MTRAMPAMSCSLPDVAIGLGRRMVPGFALLALLAHSPASGASAADVSEPVLAVVGVTLIDGNGGEPCWFPGVGSPRLARRTR